METTLSQSAQTSTLGDTSAMPMQYKRASPMGKVRERWNGWSSGSKLLYLRVDDCGLAADGCCVTLLCGVVADVGVARITPVIVRPNLLQQ